MTSLACRWLLAAVVLAGMAGCGGATKTLPGDYKLERMRDHKTYYLLGPAKEATDTAADGIVDGMVMRIGWDDEVIGVERFATFRGDPDGWMVIDIKSGKITGPVSFAEFEVVRDKHHLQIKTAEQAWKAL
nr:hypothetical protein [uncultured Duganella sp.]